MNSQHHQPDDSRDGTLTGYFVIADISGYTGFLANNELAHAQGILAELSDLLIEKLAAPFRFVELEGDAVFVFAPEAAVEDSERLVDIIEACYAAFWPTVSIQSRFWYREDWPQRDAMLADTFRYYHEVMCPGFVRMYWVW